MKKFFAAAALPLILVLASCEAIEDALDANIKPYDPTYVLELKSIVNNPRGGTLEQEVVDFYGRKYTLRRNQLIGGGHIEDVKLLPREDMPGYYDLSLKLNQTGQRLWTQLSLDNRDQPVAILIDNVYFGQFQPDTILDVDFEWVTLTGPFNEVNAYGIKRYVRKNFRHFSPRVTSLF